MLRKTTRLRRAMLYCPRAGLSLRRAEFIPLFTERIEIRSTTKLPAGSIDVASQFGRHFFFTQIGLDQACERFPCSSLSVWMVRT